MNRNQRSVVIGALVLSVAMWIYCPWRRTAVVYNPAPWLNQPNASVGYSWVFGPGDYEAEGPGAYDGVGAASALLSLVKGGPYTRRGFGANAVYRLDWPRLAMQWLLLGCVAMIGVIWLRDRPNQSREPRPDSG